MTERVQDRRGGQGLTEYLLLASLIAVTAIFVVREYADTLKTIWVGSDVRINSGMELSGKGMASR